jgi:hypothetical protein
LYEARVLLPKLWVVAGDGTEARLLGGHNAIAYSLYVQCSCEACTASVQQEGTQAAATMTLDAYIIHRGMARRRDFRHVSPALRCA